MAADGDKTVGKERNEADKGTVLDAGVTPVVVEAENISFSYGPRSSHSLHSARSSHGANQENPKRDPHRILNNVSLAAHAGEIVGLLGPNGTGKSTLLGVLTGDLAMQSGAIRLCGKDLGAYDRAALARVRSVMPQANEFPFSYLVHDVVMMGRAAWGTSDAEDAEVAHEAMVRTDVLAMEDRDITSLSGGEAARVTLARVVAQDAQVVFLDEPTAALDISHQERTMKLCRDLASEGCAVIAVMHDIALAAAYCDSIALMKEGRIVAHGSPAEVLTSEQLSYVYDWPLQVVNIADISDGRCVLAVVPER